MKQIFDNDIIFVIYKHVTLKQQINVTFLIIT